MFSLVFFSATKRNLPLQPVVRLHLSMKTRLMSFSTSVSLLQVSHLYRLNLFIGRCLDLDFSVSSQENVHIVAGKSVTILEIHYLHALVIGFGNVHFREKQVLV